MKIPRSWKGRQQSFVWLERPNSTQHPFVHRSFLEPHVARRLHHKHRCAAPMCPLVNHASSRQVSDWISLQQTTASDRNRRGDCHLAAIPLCLTIPIPLTWTAAPVEHCVTLSTHSHKVALLLLCASLSTSCCLAFTVPSLSSHPTGHSPPCPGQATLIHEITSSLPCSLMIVRTNCVANFLPSTCCIRSNLKHICQVTLHFIMTVSDSSFTSVDTNGKDTMIDPGSDGLSKVPSDSKKNSSPPNIHSSKEEKHKACNDTAFVSTITTTSGHKSPPPSQHSQVEFGCCRCRL